MKITLTLNITESEARAIWAEITEEPSETPTGQDLADFVAEHAMNTLESNWQYDYGINIDVRAGGETDTQEIVDRIRVIDQALDQSDTDQDAPEINALKEEREQLKEELGVSDLPENSEDELAEIMADYQPKKD